MQDVIDYIPLSNFCQLVTPYQPSHVGCRGLLSIQSSRLLSFCNFLPQFIMYIYDRLFQCLIQGKCYINSCHGQKNSKSSIWVESTNYLSHPSSYNLATGGLWTILIFTHCMYFRFIISQFKVAPVIIVIVNHVIYKKYIITFIRETRDT